MTDRELEVEERSDTAREVEDLWTAFRSKTDEERAYLLIRAYFDATKASGDSDELQARGVDRRFEEWLLSAGNWEAKDEALERVFMNCMNT